MSCECWREATACVRQVEAALSSPQTRRPSHQPFCFSHRGGLFCHGSICFSWSWSSGCSGPLRRARPRFPTISRVLPWFGPVGRVLGSELENLLLVSQRVFTEPGMLEETKTSGWLWGLQLMTLNPPFISRRRSIKHKEKTFSGWNEMNFLLKS